MSTSLLIMPWGSSLYQTMHITTPSGAVYALVLVDAQRASAFNSKYPRVPNPGFEPGFPDSIVNEIIDIRQRDGASEEMALAFILGEYNSGVALLKQDSNSNFQRLNTDKSTDASGHNTYTANNCQ